MYLHAVEGVVEVVSSVETIVEAEEITLTTQETKKTSDGQSTQPGEKPKTRNLTMNLTSSLKVKLQRSRMAIMTLEVKDLLETTPGLAKSMTTLEMKSSNGTRKQTTKKMMSLKTTGPIAEVALLQALVLNQEEIIKSRESTMQWVQRRTTSRRPAKS